MFNTQEHFSIIDTIPFIKVSTRYASSSLSAEGIGTVNIIFSGTPLTLKNCLFVPSLTCNLVSLLELFKDKLTIAQEGKVFSLESSRVLAIKGKVQNNLVVLNYTVPKALITKNAKNIWNHCLGHPGSISLKTMGLPDIFDQCTTCDFNKAHALPFNHQFDPVSCPLDCVHIDLVGPISPIQKVGEPPSGPPRRIKVIGPPYPTLISCNLDCSNVLPYSRQPKAFIYSCNDTPRTYQGAIKSSNSKKWMESISKELGSMNRLDVWDVVDLDPKFKLRSISIPRETWDLALEGLPPHPQDISLTYLKDINAGIVSYTDASLGNCSTTCQSVTRFLATMCGSLVLWKTRKQPTVLLFTSKAKYKALCNLTLELMWLKQWCQECGILMVDKLIPIHKDNQSCINATKGNCNLNNKRMKHIDIHLHFIKEAISSSFIKLVYTPTSNILADFLTKSVGRANLSQALDSLGIL
ncbi:hypothetical protein O181_083000 [Austropuccinia psidii MF-1]|uniref:Retrovirus-related Pol polyprotein from transposon TNT 1-94-like beta-barrel domain-containing protein n=1 Tax=Austropuccinia psidii MF-1 TaxID=1389203 RepID=A0A9Q3FMA5_9BASI|nr:hypothetical protein [Austropuccinia psidii MF-1]